MSDQLLGDVDPVSRLLLYVVASQNPSMLTMALRRVTRPDETSATVRSFICI